jgi:hypothetical protein
MTTQPSRSYTRLTIAVVVIALVVVGSVGYLILSASKATTSGPTSTISSSYSTLTSTSTYASASTISTQTLATPEQNDFTLKGQIPVPLITITPQNSTFTLTYNATTLENPVTSLSFNLSQSYISTYTNGTEWVPYSQACGSSSESSSSTESVSSQSSGFSVSIVTVSSNSCDYPAPLGWAPVNGTAVDQYARLNPNQVEMSVVPTAVAANQSMKLQFTITLNLKPGTYDVGLALGVQTNSFFEFSDLNPFPVVVKSY